MGCTSSAPATHQTAPQPAALPTLLSLQGGGSVVDDPVICAMGLEERLASMGLATVRVEDDGNCQFRALAHGLFGDQCFHASIRKVVVAYIRKHADDYEVYFDSKQGLDAYLKRIAKNRSWGDELTLTAAVRAFGCTVKVVTSEKENWLLSYTPDLQTLDPRDACCPGLPRPRQGTVVNLSYISPSHYNALQRVSKNIPPAVRGGASGCRCPAQAAL